MDIFEWIFHNLIENNILSSLASVATIITVLVSVHKYFNAKNDEKQRASKNLYLELENTLKSLDYEKHAEDFFSINIIDHNNEEKTVYFMNRSHNHDFYDSLVFSGKINFLEPKLQQMVQDIFKRIKGHNEYLSAAKDLQHAQKNVLQIKNIFACYEWINDNEMYLKKVIPKIMEELQEHFLRSVTRWRSWFARLKFYTWT